LLFGDFSLSLSCFHLLIEDFAGEAIANPIDCTRSLLFAYRWLFHFHIGHQVQVFYVIVNLLGRSWVIPEICPIFFLIVGFFVEFGFFKEASRLYFCFFG